MHAPRGAALRRRASTANHGAWGSPQASPARGDSPPICVLPSSSDTTDAAPTAITHCGWQARQTPGIRHLGRRGLRLGAAGGGLSTENCRTDRGRVSGPSPAEQLQAAQGQAPAARRRTPAGYIPARCAPRRQPGCCGPVRPSAADVQAHASRAQRRMISANRPASGYRLRDRRAYLSGERTPGVRVLTTQGITTPFLECCWLRSADDRLPHRHSKSPTGARCRPFIVPAPTVRSEGAGIRTSPHPRVHRPGAPRELLNRQQCQPRKSIEMASPFRVQLKGVTNGPVGGVGSALLDVALALVDTPGCVDVHAVEDGA